MSKYSSESDSNHAEDHYRKKKNVTKNRGRSRSSSYSSNSSHSSRKKYHKHKRYKGHRSRSRERYSKSHRSKTHSWRSSRDRSRSPSESRSRDRRSSKLKKKYKRRSSSRSVSKSRYRNRSLSRSVSKGKSRSRSKSHQRSPSQSSRDIQPSKLKTVHAKQDDLQELITKSKAKQSSDNQVSDTLSVSTVSQKREDLKGIEVIDVEPSSAVLDKINSPGFEQRAFLSSKILNPTLIPEVIEVPDKDNGVDDDNPSNLFHSRLFADHQKMEKWVKKLFNLRQKAINGEPII